MGCFERLVMLWAWGTISPQLLQHIMMLFMRDLDNAEQGMLKKDRVRKLSKLGTSGAHPNNMNHQLIDSLPATKMPSPHSFLAPLRHSILGYMHRAVDMILPHELFAAFYHHYPQAWQERVFHSTERCSRFWRSVQGSVQFLTHPVRQRENFRTHCVPLAIHGDGTPVVGIGKAWGRLMNIWSWTSLLCFSAPTILRNFLIFCIHQILQSPRAGHHTLDVVFRKMAWSFKWLWLGKWPTHDWDGHPLSYSKAGTDLAGGYFACVWALPGDLDYWRGDLNLPNSTSNDPCAICPCNSSDLPWFDFTVSALWPGKMYDIATWVASGWNRCLLFTIPGVTVHSLHPDWMHAKHLGTDKVLLGSVLYALLHFVLTAGDLEARLTTIWGEIQEVYRRDAVANRFGNLKMTMFTSRASTKLKGKAMEVCCLVPVLHKVWLRFYNRQLEVHRKIELVLRTSAHLDAILEEHAAEFVLPEEAAADFKSTGHVHLSMFYELKAHFANESGSLFQLTQKGHYVMHCCLRGDEMNPRRVWCYSGEDFMGKCRDLAASSSRGNVLWQVSQKMVKKYLRALDLTLTDPDAWFRRR